jgi:short subunit fatty acids transporter
MITFNIRWNWIMNKQPAILERFAISISNWSEKWFPDSYIFALLGVIIVLLLHCSLAHQSKKSPVLLVMAFGA